MAENSFIDEIAVAWEEEGLFARDLDGQLIRLEKATEKDYATIIEIEIDGQAVKIAKSVPSTDSQGNFLLDGEGRTIPRRSTIYDAAYLRYGEALRRDQIIPTLCHVDHLQPVGVCRVCSVEVARRERDRDDPTKFRDKAGEKLLPACVQPVEPGMVVHTRKSPVNERGRKRVETSLRVLVELLAADHLPVGSEHLPVGSDQAPSDFARLAQRLSAEKLSEKELNPARFRTGSQPPREVDNSSHFIAVDHTACILCDRCSRACNDIKGNFVIGRSGKGYAAHIGFDLNEPMGLSSCVECGECMLSCPTTALTFRQPIASQWYLEEIERPGRQAVSLAELPNVPLLDCVPQRWLEWNQTSIVRWNVKPGDTICRLGEYGATAFIIAEGAYDVLVPRRQLAQAPAAERGWFSRWFGAGEPTNARELVKADQLAPSDLIFGEMSCLSSYPRNATVKATSPGTLYVIRRNVLYNLQRNPAARKRLNGVYLERAVFDQVRKNTLFDELTPQERAECDQILLAEAKLVTLDPGQPIFRQGEQPDAFYLVRIGHVKLVETYAGQERVLTYLGPNKLFGEVAFTLGLPEFANEDSMPEELRGRRTASALALDDVELVRVLPETFRKLLDMFPAFRKRCIASARASLVKNVEQRRELARTSLTSFTEQGLYNAQKLLVIDLESCTRCDECTKACSDTHDGVARLIRDGRRFDKFLVASSCRSCTDPYCLVGCPVDAIHRDGERLEIRIESHCIGCGLCANNCPYGNINMVDSGTKWIEDPAGGEAKLAAVRHKATTCDLCSQFVASGDTVSCVYACPHHAAFRMSGAELFELVEAERTSG